MMAKRKEDRYNNIKELLTDLEDVRNGQPPLVAHKRFDVSMLEQLESGDAIEAEEKVYREDAVARYKIAILVLGAVAVVFFLVIICLLMF
jgi:hypothetical protein